MQFGFKHDSATVARKQLLIFDVSDIQEKYRNKGQKANMVFVL